MTHVLSMFRTTEFGNVKWGCYISISNKPVELDCRTWLCLDQRRNFQWAFHPLMISMESVRLKLLIQMCLYVLWKGLLKLHWIMTVLWQGRFVLEVFSNTSYIEKYDQSYCFNVFDSGCARDVTISSTFDYWSKVCFQGAPTFGNYNGKISVLEYIFVVLHSMFIFLISNPCSMGKSYLKFAC